MIIMEDRPVESLLGIDIGSLTISLVQMDLNGKIRDRQFP
jgi:activator of 2-hydroxyglutaryl-CoA dehydratase